MTKPRMIIILTGLIFALLIILTSFPIHLNDTSVKRVYDKAYGNYRDLSLSNTHFDGINQKIIIKTQYEHIGDINEDVLMDATRDFMLRLQKYIIPKKIDFIWIIFTNPQGHSIESMWTSEEYLKRVKWNESTNKQFKSVMNFGSP